MTDLGARLAAAIDWPEDSANHAEPFAANGIDVPRLSEIETIACLSFPVGRPRLDRAAALIPNGSVDRLGTAEFRREATCRPATLP